MTVIAVLPGDGIGPEVIQEAVRTLDELDLGLTFDVLEHVNADTFLASGTALTADDVARIQRSDAALLGAVGDPRVTTPDYVRGVLLRLRFELDLYVNHRAVSLLADHLSPLKDTKRGAIDCVVVRENSEGLYAGIGGSLRQSTPQEVALDVEVNTYTGVSRLLDYAFDIARSEVCMVDKSNAVPNGGRLWQRCWAEHRGRHPGTPTRHLYVDAAAMLLVADPASFDVIVTNNSYGDILSDLAAELGGGIGTAASGNLNPTTGFGLYEPVHGSAPDIAGLNRANPVAAILSAALMVERLGHGDAAAAVRSAVARAVIQRRCTPDLGGSLTTTEAGAAIRAELG
ncbi:isocitrate/isopropylmalate dehydrogenase family protein [Saccharothrix coeruleofusca]|uniref:3-isopropylmalate dehydrogenase n=1 Tax=Saccharothrix coeruleofusca TaxID=33919 RepID=A0A918ATX9_9PSEU|nr:isocitrate/isopropylmalate family dehydrogenase [Saccharothrix coeruleofusca]MBP2336012.1 3-isopropylmalate dehydrogenase [Saccharothrix coeruleofusca]GGP76015.1 3-isopropylmalate dehydrogenase [Saccharothrix coeruleofusca]